MEPEVALVTAGVETDVLGIGYNNLKQAVKADVLEHFVPGPALVSLRHPSVFV
jgi:hypothetical protein